MIHPFLSLQSRFRGWILRHFSLTPFSHSLKKLKSTHVGEACFFIGNGPSLKAEDLTALHDAGVATFGFNRIYNIFDQTPWRPTFYISQDEKMLAGCADAVNGLGGELPCKFIPIQLKWWHNIQIGQAYFFNIAGQNPEFCEAFQFSDDISAKIFNSSTGMYTAAQIAAYMGFSKIYLLGVDHHFRISQNNLGEIIVDNSTKDYFSEKYNEDKSNLYIPNTEQSTLTYLAMKQHCRRRRIQVYNATRGGKLEVFPRVSFEEAMEQIEK